MKRRERMERLRAATAQTRARTESKLARVQSRLSEMLERLKSEGPVDEELEPTNAGPEEPR